MYEKLAREECLPIAGDYKGILLLWLEREREEEEEGREGDGGISLLSPSFSL